MNETNRYYSLAMITQFNTEDGLECILGLSLLSLRHAIKSNVCHRHILNTLNCLHTGTTTTMHDTKQSVILNHSDLSQTQTKSHMSAVSNDTN